MKILISSNCVTGGLMGALTWMGLPDVGAEPYRPDETYEQWRQRIHHSIAAFDVWVFSGTTAPFVERFVAEEAPKVTLLKIPELAFAAYHPDLVYVRHKPTSQLTLPHYNSAIAFWMYTAGIAPARADEFFNGDTYARLGYFDFWARSVANLKTAFDNSDLAEYFNEFFLAAKRHGAFMHSINHPKISAIRLLAGLILKRLRTQAMPSLPTAVMSDSLRDHIWPVYPEIADRLGLHEGGYVWRFARFVLRSPEAYVQFSHRHFAARGIPAQDIAMEQRDFAALDAAMRKALS